MPGGLTGRGTGEGRALARRYAVMLAVSLVVHLLLGLALIVFGVDPPALAEEDETFVPLSLEPPPEPAPAVPPPAEPETPPEAEEEQEQEQEQEREIPEDASLLGFRSEGTIKARPDRPVGPEAEIKGSAGAGGGEADDVPEELPADDPVEAVDAPPVDAPEEIEEEEAAEPEPLEGPPLEEPAGEAVDIARPSDDAPRRGTPEPLLPQLETPRPVPRPAPDRPRGPGESSLDFDVGIEGGMFGNLDFDSPDYNWSEYSTKVYFAIYRAWLRELHARARRFEREQKLEGFPRLEGEVAIHFVINRDGSVTNLDVVAPSVLGNLDDASKASLLGAVLPPLPGDFPRDREGVTFRFVLSVDNALLMERVLSNLRARGQF